MEKTTPPADQFAALDWVQVLEKIQELATSESTRSQIAELPPLPSLQIAQAECEKVFQAVGLLNLSARPFMESLDLYDTWFSRLKKQAVLKTLELRDVRLFCLEGAALAEVFKKASPELSWAAENLKSMMDLERPLSALDQTITPRGEMRDDASETLFRLIREKESLARQVQSQLDKLVKAHEMENYLQDKYVTTREGRWVLPIKSGYQHQLPGMIHGSSQTKQTVYIEPETILPMNNRLRLIEVEIEDEIERILVSLSQFLSSQVIGFAQLQKVLQEADFTFAKAQFALAIDAEKFTFSTDTMDLTQIRHPLLQLEKQKPVSNSLRLDQKKNILLLSGPNAGGKTVLLKSVGLACQMARCGIPPCAGADSQIPFFKNILCVIGDTQNVDEHLSTFAGHLLNLQKASLLKGPENLILVDEICGSTDPEEGSSLARSFIEHFCTHHIFAVVTSHLSPLKRGWKETDPVQSGSLEYDLRTNKPTYQFLAGIPGDSLAIKTAQRVGVSFAIIDRALELVSPEQKKRFQALDEIENLKKDLVVYREHLESEKKKCTQEKLKYQELKNQLEREKAQALEKFIKENQKLLDEMIAQAKADQTFKKHLTFQEIKAQMPQMIKAANPSLQATDGQGSQNAINTPEEFAQRFPAGSRVFIPSLNQDGLVQSAPNGKGDVLVLANSLRLNVFWKELKPAQKGQNPTADLVRKSSTPNMGLHSVSLHSEDRVLDFRGKTVDDALVDLEMALDRGGLAGDHRIKIIHGHGTEALKKSIRAHLSRSVHVKKWTAGTPQQGGDGITWVELG